MFSSSLRGAPAIALKEKIMSQVMFGVETEKIDFAFYHKNGSVWHWIDDESVDTNFQRCFISDSYWENEAWDRLQYFVDNELAAYLAYLLVAQITDSQEVEEYLVKTIDKDDELNAEGYKAWAITVVPDSQIIFYEENYELWECLGKYYMYRTAIIREWDCNYRHSRTGLSATIISLWDRINCN
jgi:hypothetical protein